MHWTFIFVYHYTPTNYILLTYNNLNKYETQLINDHFIKSEKATC